jgi:hypothetical protein
MTHTTIKKNLSIKLKKIKKKFSFYKRRRRRLIVRALFNYFVPLN